MHDGSGRTPLADVTTVPTLVDGDGADWRWNGLRYTTVAVVSGKRQTLQTVYRQYGTCGGEGPAELNWANGDGRGYSTAVECPVR